jgi:hypothetical protein
MADLVITAANVVMGAGATVKIKHGILGATVTAGQGIVKDPATSKYVPADSNHATAALRRTDGVALNGGALDQPVTLQEEGPITIGAAVVSGTIYVQSDAPGGIAPAADLGAGEEVTVLGVGISATQIALKINRSQAVV